MFNLQQFYIDAEAGNEINLQNVIEYVNGFESVIIWGAGNLGTALGRDLIEKGIQISGYWDQNYSNIKERNGIQVFESFGSEPHHNKNKTLIVCGIANGTHSHLGQDQFLKGMGYNNYILGMPLYEGIVCPMRKGQSLEVANCTGTSICNFNTCKKYMSILENSKEETDYRNVIQVLEIIVSRKCTLDCLECGQRVGRIKDEQPDKYVVYPLDRIIQDIDIIMENVDVVGTFSIIGGEPFTHPHLAEIVQHCLSKPNVAIISITTNGVCKITQEMLLKMKSDRVKINFSNYTQSLDDNCKKLFAHNVALVEQYGLNCNVATPVWGKVKDVVEVDLSIDEQYYINTKQQCQFGPSVSNGTFFACPVTELYDKLEEVDVSKDSVDLTKSQDFRKSFHTLLKQPYYEACKHRCGNKLLCEEVAPGVQR